MKNKTKLGLSILTGLTGLSVAMPLATACAKTNKYINHVHESEEDKLYGINANTYTSVKKDYSNQFQDQLLERGLIEGSDEWNQEMDKLNYSLNLFDEKSKTMEMSYGQLTTGVMNYAKRMDHLSLHRTTAAKPSDVDDMYQGARNSFDLYMDQLGFSTSLKETVLNDADGKFATLKNQLQEKGTMENDPYGALQEARSSLLGFFELINAEISRFASIATLSNFRKLYTLSCKDTTYLNDLLENPEFQEGKELSSDLMNQIFVCIDNENGTPTTFRNDIMAGYVLTPTLKEVKIDNKTNKHEIDIQWSCISKTYINSNDAETIKTATAYDYDGNVDQDKFQKVLTLESPTINQVFEALKIEPRATQSTFSLDKEKQNFQNTYFNDANVSHITFKFPEASDPHAKLDPFYMSSHGIYTDKEGTHPGEMSTESLAKAGMMISSDGGETYEYLSDVINSISVNDFDLSKATLAQQFVASCTVNAKINEIDKKTHTIGIDLYAKYSNSSYTQDLVDENWYPVAKTQCSNYVYSEEEFQEISRNYSKAYDYVDMYRKTQIDSLMKALVVNVALASLGFAIAGVAIGVNTTALVKGIVAKQPFVIALAAIGLVVSLACEAGFTTGIVIYSKKIDEGREFTNALKKFNNDERVQHFFKKLDEDSKVFVRYDQLSGYKQYIDSDEVYKEKLKAFQSESSEYYLLLDAYYRSSIGEDGWFDAIAKKMPVDVSKKAYQKTINNLSSENKDIKIADLCCTIATVVLSFDVVITLGSVAGIKSISAKPAPSKEEIVEGLVETKTLEKVDEEAIKAKKIEELLETITVNRLNIDTILNQYVLKQINCGEYFVKKNLCENAIDAAKDTLILDYGYSRSEINKEVTDRMTQRQTFDD